MRICGADAGDGGSRGTDRRESARAAESARGESCSLSLSLSLSLASARGAARPAGRESAEAALEPATGPQTPQTHTSHARQRESGAFEHSLSLSHRDYKVFKRNTTIAKKSMLRQNRESSRGESPRRTPTRATSISRLPRARGTQRPPGPRRTDCGGITEAPVDPPGTRRHTSSPHRRGGRCKDINSFI